MCSSDPPANERYEEGREMTLACDPDEILHVPPDADPVEFAGRLIEAHIGADAPRRAQFLSMLAEWVETQTRDSARSS